MFDHDTTGVQESGEFKPMPEGTYTFRIGEKSTQQTRNGDPCVKVELIVHEGEYKGRKVFHFVSFLPKKNDGAGICKRWLHAIGEPYEGKITVNPQNWGGLVTCDVFIDEYEKRDGSKGYSNKISTVHLPDLRTQVTSKSVKDTSTDDIPF